nr:uncharacterized protein LOC122321052 [Drosophila bipectinata]
MNKSRPYLTTLSNEPRPGHFRMTYSKFEGECKSLSKVQKSLGDINVKRNNEDNIILLTHKVSPATVVVKNIQANRHTDTIINIRDHYFMCHAIILKLYSKQMFKNLGKNMLNISTRQLSPNGFSNVYQWMISEMGTIPMLNMPEVLRAASYLEITELLEHAWNVLNSHIYTNFSAFNIMFKVRHAYELDEINEMMASRISKATLVILSSREFLCLNENQVCHLLASSSLAVNSEMELLYSAFMWLNHLWPCRRSSTAKILQNIRFAFMSPTMLNKFKKLECHNTGTFSQIFNEFTNLPKLTQLIQDALFCSTLVITTNNEPTYIKENLEYTQIKSLAPRRWMFDTRCEHHLSMRQQCPNMQYISFEQFKNYLYILEKSERDFDQFMECGDDNEDSKKHEDCQIETSLGKITIHSMLNVKHLSQYIKLLTGNINLN